MLDLAIALVWTPLGIAALVAAAAAVAALIYLPKAALPLALVAVLLAGVAYVSHLQADLASSRAEAAAAKADAAAKGRAIVALESDAAESAKRAKATAAAHVRIVMPEGDGWVHTPGHVSARSEKGEKGWAHIRPTPVPQVVRIYGRGRWDMHGRLYGWWQQLPEDRRAELLINDEVAFEADWSACHPTLLYAMAGKVPVGDVYKVDGYHRDHGKAALNRAINCRSLNGAVLSLLKDEHDNFGSWPNEVVYTKRLVHAVADRNSDIRQYLGSDAGIRLMHVESEMRMDVLKRCERENVPVLPVHDGFVTQGSKRAEIIAIMAEVMDATCVAIKSRGASIKGKMPPQMGARVPVGGVSPVPSPSREAEPKKRRRRHVPSRPYKAVTMDMRGATTTQFRDPTPWMVDGWQYRRSLAKGRAAGIVEAEAYVRDDQSAVLKYAMGDSRNTRLPGDVGLAQDRILLPTGATSWRPRAFTPTRPTTFRGRR